MKYILVLGIFGFSIFGCVTENGAPTEKIIHDTVRVYISIHDTIYTNPPALGAPTITYLGIDNGQVALRWTVVVGAIGYNVFKSTSSTGPWVLEQTGTWYVNMMTNPGRDRIDAWGTVFFIVVPVNNNGVSGPASPYRAIVH